MKEHKYEISAVYFPNYHAGDPHNEQWHGKGWSEWELVRRAGPRFAGHRMPKEPLWGYEDEADVAVMDRKIRTAVEYGITNMLFDWYWYEDGPFSTSRWTKRSCGATARAIYGFRCCGPIMTGRIFIRCPGRTAAARAANCRGTSPKRVSFPPWTL